MMSFNILVFLQLQCSHFNKDQHKDVMIEGTNCQGEVRTVECLYFLSGLVISCSA